MNRAVSIRSLSVQRAPAQAPRFAETFCSQCGVLLGPGDSGVSDCLSHRCASRPARAARALPFDSVLDQRLRADIALQSVAIQRYPSRRRWNELRLATALAVVIAVVGLVLWA